MLDMSYLELDGVINGVRTRHHPVISMQSGNPLTENRHKMTSMTVLVSNTLPILLSSYL